ncbi:MAG: tRNA preQ1(34) S-adenosylmethionine ribosyltransferase-isomerase QueA [Pyrinomonadaceae bacterium]|nr:tRNA preQ1(34) S-adenosylmethionine ribosyltransferase-isomerase QueA [Phycisphaerales bacterium]
MLRTSDLDYELPERLIAVHAVEPRDSARMMVVSRSDGGREGGTGVGATGREQVEHRHVRDLTAYVRAGDLLVLNTTRVLPARLIGVRADTGAKVQGLYVGPGTATESEQDARAALGPTAAPPGDPILWNVLLKMRRSKPGAIVTLVGPDEKATGVSLRLLSRATSGDGIETGGWNVCVECIEGGTCTLGATELLGKVGHTPLPPYILSARKQLVAAQALAGLHSASTLDRTDRERYQTVYADPSQGQSVAAPTAGLHFTPELLIRLKTLGVRTASVVLHVGLGTFKPVDTEYVEQHPMHEEWCQLPGETAQAILATRNQGGRVLAVGTTAARTLESFEELGQSEIPGDVGHLQQDRTHFTRLLITPGYSFKHIDGLLTNFHLPRSTLLAMVAALLGDEHTGVQRLLDLYRTAIEQEYRFYSFGDAMLVLP